MRAWIRILDAPGCYERVAQAEKSLHYKAQNCRAVCTKKSGLNASGHRDALSNDRRESAAHFERPAMQVLALATKPRAKREARSVCCHTYLSSLVATFKQSENVAIAHLQSSCFL